MPLFLPAGISQSYISQWLLQQGLEMSDSKRRAFYRWYLLERNNPGERSQLDCTSDKGSDLTITEQRSGGDRSLQVWWMYRTGGMIMRKRLKVERQVNDDRWGREKSVFYRECEPLLTILPPPSLYSHPPPPPRPRLPPAWWSHTHLLIPHANPTLVLEVKQGRDETNLYFQRKDEW